MLNIAGYTPFSTVDWPGKLASVLFLQGCPIRCNYCHNFEILDPKVKGPENWDDIYEKLQKRTGLIDAVIFSGGEALMQKETISAMKAVKELGFLVGLHTAGLYPEQLKLALPYLDWVGYDVKAPLDDPEKYGAITNAPKTLPSVIKGLEILRDSNVDFETRTTFDKTVLDQSDLDKIDRQLRELGITKPNKIQEARSLGAPEKYAEEMKKLVKKSEAKS